MTIAGGQQLKGLAHIGSDRALGYGLKPSESFHRPHGLIGKAGAQ